MSIAGMDALDQGTIDRALRNLDGTARKEWLGANAILGTSLAVAYLIGTLAVFGGFRLIGYPVRYASVAWPRSWWQINAARAQYFLKKGADALAPTPVS